MGDYLGKQDFVYVDLVIDNLSELESRVPGSTHYIDLRAVTLGKVMNLTLPSQAMG